MSETSPTPPADAAALRDPEATRLAILRATQAMIDSAGDSGVRVAHVARTAGVTTGAIYNLFDSREGLIAAALADSLQQIAVRTQRAQADLGAATGQNPLFSEQYLQEIAPLFTPQGRPDRIRWAASFAKAQHNETLAKQIIPSGRVVLDSVVEEVKFAQRQGWLRSDVDAHAVAVLMYGVTIGIAITARVYDDVEDFPERLLEAWTYFSRAFLPPGVQWP
jgi:AcrR family transcriptional regulator